MQSSAYSSTENNTMEGEPSLECYSVYSVIMSHLYKRQSSSLNNPNVEELSLQGTCHMAAIWNVLASNQQNSGKSEVYNLIYLRLSTLLDKGWKF